YVSERMLDRLAAHLQADPAEVRRKNLIPADKMPYDTGFPQGKKTLVYDGGDYPRLLSTALEQIGYQQLREEQKQARDGRRLGVGIACCVESSGFGTGEPAGVGGDGNPAGLYIEDAVVHVRGVPQKSIPVIEVFPHGLEVEEAFNTKTGTAYASSWHVAAVSIDPETGSVEMLKYAIVHD